MHGVESALLNCMESQSMHMINVVNICCWNNRRKL